jgi:CrcB protein
MKDALFVGIGGFFGCIFRYLVSILAVRIFDESALPWGTFAVNILGCFFIGFLGTLAENSQIISPPMQLVLIVGFLGGFTTYSAFGWQTLTLLRDGFSLIAAINVAAHIILGIGAVWLGAVLAKK